jgi:rhombotail lipoprotein
MSFRAIFFLSLLAAAGCTFAGHSSQSRNSSSLVSFLYPNGSTPPQQNAIPELHVPLRVGLAFLPTQRAFGDVSLDAAHKEELLERIRRKFSDRKFVSEIVIIPDYYLATSRGFEGLQGVQRLYNVDLMAVVSYDQVTYTDDNKWSLGYLTIVGAYVVKGNTNDTTTLVDLAVVDPRTRSLELRAGGTDTHHQNSTMIDSQRDIRLASAASFDAATEQMIIHFDSALTAFQTDVHEGRANVHVVARSSSDGSGGGHSSGGGGSMGGADLVALAALVLFSMRAIRARTWARCGIPRRTRAVARPPR